MLTPKPKQVLIFIFRKSFAELPQNFCGRKTKFAWDFRSVVVTEEVQDPGTGGGSRWGGGPSVPEGDRYKDVLHLKKPF